MWLVVKKFDMFDIIISDESSFMIVWLFLIHNIFILIHDLVFLYLRGCKPLDSDIWRGTRCILRCDLASVDDHAFFFFNLFFYAKL